MRKHRIVRGIALLAGVLTLALGGTALAFHEGGVAHCDGCHSMHNSPDNPVSGSTNNLLLKGSDPSSTCLNCHALPRSYSVLSSNASHWSPGGDFFWITTSYSNVVRGNTVTSDPDQMGHNVVASDFTLLPDGNNAVAPGGTYDATILGCESCHDPHGQVAGGTANGQPPISVSGSYGEAPAPGTIAGNYRLLADQDYTGGGAAINTAAPKAATAGFDETDASHVAYGQGMSEWCANCHGTYINDSHKHPAGNGQHLNSQAANYNSYVSTGDFNGAQGTAYTALVPFEHQITDPATLLPLVTSSGGPISGNENVMCLTCHRAHASAFTNITRWDMEQELLTHSFPNAANLVAMGALPDSAYYGRDIATVFDPYQRSLCNKCHVKD